MRRVTVVVAAWAVAACSVAEADDTTTITAQPALTTTTHPPSTTTSSPPPPVGGHLVRLDIETLEPLPGLEPIPLTRNSWNITSDDGSRIVNVQHNGTHIVTAVTPIDVDGWEPGDTFDVTPHTARVVHQDHLYMYDGVKGQVLAMDLDTGDTTKLGEWRPGLSMWDELLITGDGRIASLGSAETDVIEHVAHHSVFVLDPVSGETTEIPIGPIERMNEETGIFDGDYEIPETDAPGVVWGDNRLYIAHAVGPEVTIVDLDNGDVLTHSLEASSWWDRFLAYWMPPAVAKGPSMGTYSSAALSSDGRYLVISGNRYDVVVTDDGTLLEESEHLGLTVVDTETWEVVAASDLPIQFVRNAGDTILAVDTTSTSPWLDDIYVLSIDGSGAVTVEGPFTVQGGGCQPASDTTYLICSEYVSDTTQRLRVVDMATSETVSERVVGWEDYLNDNGVFVDWSPFDS